MLTSLEWPGSHENEEENATEVLKQRGNMAVPLEFETVSQTVPKK